MNRFLQLTAIGILTIFGLGLFGFVLTGGQTERLPTRPDTVLDVANGAIERLQVDAGRATASLTPACKKLKTGEACSQATDCCSQLCMSGTCQERRNDWDRRDERLSCGLPGESCAKDSACCSDRCAPNGKCRGGDTALTCAYVDQACSDDIDCCSRRCGRSTGRCEPQAQRECAAPGKVCEELGDCCSGSCERVAGVKRCKGTSKDPARLGEFCERDGECFIGGECTNNRCVVD